MEPIEEESALEHIGIKRRSGRYPWGSGGNAYQRAQGFQSYLEDLRSQGLTDAQVAQGLGIKTGELRDTISLAREVIYAENQALAVRLSNKGTSNRAIATRILGDPNKESTVRGWLKTAEEIKDKTITAISNLLKEHVMAKEWVDVGKGNELYLGVSDVKLRSAISALKDEGYKVHLVKLPQLGTDKLTEYKILGKPNTTWGEARRALVSGQVSIIKDKSDDGGLTFMRPKADPVSMDSKRIAVRYGKDGGREMDGIIELRRNVPEIDIGANHYAQVRIAVDGTHYLKGMALYSDDLPPGVDIRYNTPKENTGSKLDAMKPLDLSPEAAGNRFGATTRPHVYKDADGKVHTSVINFVNEEGDWDRWSRNLSSQFLSKQPVKLAATQLSKAQSKKQEDLDKIMALTNPVVKKQLLMDFADSADSDAIHLKAAKLPGQSTHVILPMNSMRPTEIFAPQFNTGDRVALVRHPHSGPFEIPELTVNNNNTTAKRLMGSVRDAVGIHHSVAQQLSGADFDGDTVLVIPNKSGRVKSQPMLDELKDFDPKSSYPEVPGMTYMTKENTQKEMGKVSNLITDMSIKGAETNEIVRAVKHSMVVIDAEKKKLNYKLSEQDNGIAQLKAKYQRDPDNPRASGASTIISRSSSEARIPEVRLRRQSEGGPIDPKTGELVYVPTGRTYVKTEKDPVTGKYVPVTKKDPVTGEQVPVIMPKETKISKGDSRYTKDAYDLSSGEPMEAVYASHANAMKAMANEARKAAVSIKDPPQSAAAKAYYAKEVESLKAKLKNAQMNAPLERRAQAIATATAKARIDANPGLTKKEIKKIKYQSLTDARTLTGAAKERIGTEKVPLTEREWFAIQAGAVSSTMLREILNNSNMDRVKELATPRYRSSLTPGQLALAKTMASSGRGLSEIAAALGIPRSTIADNLANA